MAERDEVCATPWEVNLGGIMDAGGVAHDHVEPAPSSFINCLIYRRALRLELAISLEVIPTEPLPTTCPSAKASNQLKHTPQHNMGDYTAEIEQIYAGLTDQPPHTEEQKVMAKKIIELHLATFKYYDYKRTFELVDENYRQHSQMVADGRDSIIEASKVLKSIAAKNWKGPGEPHFNMMFKRILVDGDYIVAQIFSERWPGDAGEHVFDLYRWKNGKVVEHWDVIQQVDAANMKHGNSVA
ncbi:hypothetical protein H9L39_02158, partial [Fusarium oxysporum f. sp. albedinis]